MKHANGNTRFYTAPTNGPRFSSAVQWLKKIDKDNDRYRHPQKQKQIPLRRLAEAKDSLNKHASDP